MRKLMALSAKKPRVRNFCTLKSHIESNAYFGGINGTLQIGVDITAFVGLCEQIMKVKHGYGVVFHTEMVAVIEVPANIVYLTIRNKQLRYRSLITSGQRSI